jgi:hypothetical protein
MVTIETTIEVDEQGKVTIQMPADVRPGLHRAVVVVFDEPEVAAVHPGMADFPRHDVAWTFPEGYTFRREDMYDDSGRGA